jgi:hypothetical protein
MLKVKLENARLTKKLLAMGIAVEAADKVALAHAGENIVDGIHETLDKQMVEGPALATTTIQLKGHSLKLLETYQMRDSVEWRHTDDGVEAGVFPDAPNKRGLIAKIHEHGNDWVPKRAFVAPTWDRIKKDVIDQYDKDLQEQLLLLAVIT